MRPGAWCGAGTKGRSTAGVAEQNARSTAGPSLMPSPIIQVSRRSRASMKWALSSGVAPPTQWSRGIASAFVIASTRGALSPLSTHTSIPSARRAATSSAASWRMTSMVASRTTSEPSREARSPSGEPSTAQSARPRRQVVRPRTSSSPAPGVSRTVSSATKGREGGGLEGAADGDAAGVGAAGDEVVEGLSLVVGEGVEGVGVDELEGPLGEGAGRRDHADGREALRRLAERMNIPARRKAPC